MTSLVRKPADTVLMATLDIFILVVIGIGLLRGWRTGFLRQISSLGGTILAFVLAASFMETIGQLITVNTGFAPEQSALLGFIGVFMLVKILVNVVIRTAERLLEAVKLSGLDRLAGGITGGFKAAIALSLVFVCDRFCPITWQSFPRIAQNSISRFIVSCLKLGAYCQIGPLPSKICAKG